MRLKRKIPGKIFAVRNVCLLLAVVLAFGAAAFTPAIDGTARAVDFDKACSLTVNPGSGEFSEDLASAGIVIDLYPVAGAAPVGGHDTYTYDFTGDFASLSISDQPDQDEWKALSQKAAAIALKDVEPSVKGAAAWEAIPDLSCGLYLVIARGGDREDYVVTVENEAGEQSIATVAYSGEYIYTIAPALVSLPGKEADENGDSMTSGSGEWIYDVETDLKIQRALRYGALEITKRLASYETKDPATFVFSVEAKLKDKTVYSDVVSLTFTAPGEKKTLIEKIPVGAQVTVTEVYSGAVYEPTVSAEQTAVIEAEQAANVTFENDYNETHKGGGSVVNRFDYHSDTGWGWTKITDEE